MSGHTLRLDGLHHVQYECEYSPYEPDDEIALDDLCHFFLGRMDPIHKQFYLFVAGGGWVAGTRLAKYQMAKPERSLNALHSIAWEVLAMKVFERDGYVQSGLLCAFPVRVFRNVVRHILGDRRSGLFFMRDPVADWSRLNEDLFMASIPDPTESKGLPFRWEAYLEVIVRHSGEAVIPTGWFDYGAVYLNHLRSGA